MLRFFLFFVLLFLLWLINTQQISTFFLVSGTICTSFSILFSVWARKKLSPYPSYLLSWKIFQYIPWITWQAFCASIDVTKCVYSRQRPLPKIVKITCPNMNNESILLFANSITLTPGTISMDIDKGNNIYVHGLTTQGAEQTASDTLMKQMVKSSFISYD